jgi:hypothetical protein
MSGEYAHSVSDLSAAGSEPWHKQLFKGIDHKGPLNLFWRSLLEVVQGILSFLAVLTDSDSSGHLFPRGICQIVAALTLLVQFKTAHPSTFAVRALADFAQAGLLIRAVACGLASFGDDCHSGWGDARAPILVVACLEAIRMTLLGISLLIQLAFPKQGWGQHGNNQLLCRGMLQICGIAVQYSEGMMKNGSWFNTEFETRAFEVVMHFARAFILLPLLAWALFDQWVSCGTGARTDDIRTSGVAEAHPNRVDNVMHKVSPHKGHRNLLIRALTTTGQASVTMWLIIYGVGRARLVPHICGQLVGALSLLIQWRKGNPKMFLVRGASNWWNCLWAIYGCICGTSTWYGSACQQAPWKDERVYAKILSALLAFRLFCNGCSLFCQYKYPQRMFRGHGNAQLFFRGLIQASGIPLHVAAFCLKGVAYKDPDFKPYHAVDISANLIRGLLFIPISSASLLNQWYNTGPGNTGHAVSDRHERMMDTELVNPHERLRVTIFSARGLRRADVFTSDPYCTCKVMGRPNATVSTKWISKTLAPEWNESFELPEYQFHDSLQFIVRDHDEPAKGCCGQLFDDGDDYLGDVVLRSNQIHPDGFDGELHLKHAGRYHKNASVKVKVEILGKEVEFASEAESTNISVEAHGKLNTDVDVDALSEKRVCDEANIVRLADAEQTHGACVCSI